MDPVRIQGELSRPWSTARLALLVLPIGYSVAAAGGRPGWSTLALAVAAGLVPQLGGRAPALTALGQSLLLVAVELWTDASEAPFKLMASLAVAELALRRPLRATMPGVVVLTLATAWPMVSTAWPMVSAADTVDLSYLAHRVTFVVLAPLLLGAWLGAAAEAIRQSRAAARAAEDRRAQEVQSARLAERTDIAREVHDLVAHHVASIALRTAVAREVVTVRDTRISTLLDEVHEAAVVALGDLRRLVVVLRDPTTIQQFSGSMGPGLIDPADLPLLVQTAVERSITAGLQVTAEVEADTGRLDAVRALTALRVVQEGLTNVGKHAGPGASASVELRVGEDEMSIVVTDHGRAHPAGTLDLDLASSGIGLIGLRERLELLRGHLEAGPLRRGWRLQAHLPLVSADESDIAGKLDGGAATGAQDASGVVPHAATTSTAAGFPAPHGANSP